MAAARVPCSNAGNIAEKNTRLGPGCKVNFAPGKILSEGKSPRKCIVPAQEMAKHRAQFGCPPVS